MSASCNVTFSPAVPSLPVPLNGGHGHAPPLVRRPQEDTIMLETPATATPAPVPPSRFVRAVIRPLTKVLNPRMVKKAGQPGFDGAAQIHHVGRRSGRPYVTPAGGRLAGELFVIPLPFGNQSDWVGNVRAAGGCTVRRNGPDSPAVHPG